MVKPVPPLPDDDERQRTTGSLLETAVEATDVAVVVVDAGPGHRVVWANPAARRTTGPAGGQVVGSTWQLLADADGAPDGAPGGAPDGAVHRLRAALGGGHAATEVLPARRADGTWGWTEVVLTPLPAGGVGGFVAVQVDVTERVRAERWRAEAVQAERAARERLALLADVAEAVADLDSPVAMRSLAQCLTRSLVPWCAVLVADEVLRVVATSGLADTPRSGPYRLGCADMKDPLAAQVQGPASGCVAVDLRDEPAPVGDPGAAVQEPPVGQWLAAQLRREGASEPPGAAVSFAVPGRASTLGLIVVGCPDDGLEQDDTDLLAECARRLGLSLENARLYTQQHLLAETLQRSMLPDHSGAPGLDLWSYYAPSETHAQVGGDWYDVLHPGDDAVGVVIGDVVGHDIEAAAAMGQLRSVVRAYAHEQEEPGTVLMRVDQLVAGMRITRSASMVYARLEDLGDGRWEMAWSRAGHLPPVLLSGGRVSALEEAAGTLVGVGDRPRSTAVAELEPGDVVVLCTDGLIERRSRPLRDGFAALLAACEGLGGIDAAGVGEHLLTTLADAPEDDVALVVVRIPTATPVVGAAGPRRRRWQLPGEPGSVARARRLVVAACSMWGTASSTQAELVASELVGNAVLHGWGPVDLRLSQDAEGLRLEVQDANPMPPGLVTSEREGPGGYGLHVVQRLSEWGWYPAGAGKVVWARLAEPG